MRLSGFSAPQSCAHAKNENCSDNPSIGSTLSVVRRAVLEVMPEGRGGEGRVGADSGAGMVFSGRVAKIRATPKGSRLSRAAKPV